MLHWLQGSERDHWLRAETEVCRSGGGVAALGHPTPVPPTHSQQLTWLALGGDQEAHSRKVEQLTAL